MTTSEILFVDEFVLVKWHPKIRAHYEALGYVYTGHLSDFLVRPSELSTGSHIRVRVRCPKCEDVRSVPFKDVCRSGNSICKWCIDVKDIVGQKFGSLTAIRPTDRRSGKNLVWLCRCDCGNEVYASSGLLGRPGKHCCNRGACNSRWNDNLSREQRIFHRGRSSYTEWRGAVFERDGFACQACGDDRGGNLEAHHLDSWDNHRNGRFDVSNGATLCKLCHKSFHDAYGYGNNTRDQYEQWIGS